MILLLLVCFFFFKQKTAYEMRISDWSSDVCSSDLEAAIAALPEEIAGLPEIERTKSAPALKQDAAPVEDLSGLQAEVAANPQDQIGRASCRERVCQYV